MKYFKIKLEVIRMVITSNIKLIGSNVTAGGTFTLSAESQCRDEHRNICNHNSTSQTLVVIN